MPKPRSMPTTLRETFHGFEFNGGVYRLSEALARLAQYSIQPGLRDASDFREWFESMAREAKEKEP